MKNLKNFVVLSSVTTKLNGSKAISAPPTPRATDPPVRQLAPSRRNLQSTSRSTQSGPSQVSGTVQSKELPEFKSFYSPAAAAPLANNHQESKLDDQREELDAELSERLQAEAQLASGGGEHGKSVQQELITHSDAFCARHLGPSELEIKQMLQVLGYDSVRELIDETIPKEIRLNRELRLPEALSEHELVEELRRLGALNTGATEWRSFIGLGYYDCIVPSVIMRNVFENPGWTTAYTAYQAEIAQGRLESLMNFQTMVADLTGLDVANASLLDEATAAAEAMQVCLRVDTKRKRNKFLISANCHPQTRAVLETRARALGVQVDTFDELQALETHPLDFGQYCGVLLQYPNTSGHLFDLGPLTKAAHSQSCLVVVATDLLACTLFKPPGDFEEPADLAIGSAQRFGVPLNFGGPHAAFLACRKSLVRSIPGRVVGLTRDSQGSQAYRFALQTREQHIRRDKATSNICTAQALLANMSAMYAIYHGPAGLERIARSIHLKTNLLASLIAGSRAQVSIANQDSFFDTLTMQVGDKQTLDAIKRRASEAKINLRFWTSADPRVSVSLDETTKLADVFELARIFSPSVGESTKQVAPLDDPKLASLRRQTKFLEHPTFNRYHSEAKLVRYIKQLENKDISLAHSMIPLGSCTMKLNATSQMLACSWPEYTRNHPFQPRDQSGGYEQLFSQLEEYLCEITGYDRVSFQPNSGAQGEYAGLRAIKSYLESRGESQRNVCLIPVSAHGTNPASAQMAGFQIESVRVNEEHGNIDMDHLRDLLDVHGRKLACLMITYPSTFGIFEQNVSHLCQLIHAHGGQVYLDGANMNAQVGLCRPGVYGADVSHLNLHKTFCIPHGGGGPGAGPIGVKSHLAPFLPSHPLVECGVDSASSFGTVSASAWGSPAILPISWSYIRLMGKQLRRSSELAILNANYMRARLEQHYKILFRAEPAGNVAHEFIIDCRPFKRSANVEAGDIAKRLQDFGLHAPTVSWPVSNTLMIEPTESEDKQQLDNYCDALVQIRNEISLVETGKMSRDLNPIKGAPHTQQVVCADEWTREYTRQQAAFPAPFVRPENKIWPTVGRVDDTFGDTNLFCSCAPQTEAE